ncbi:MAG: hypothetical protein DMF69_08240 [Acidobacteria bacterium]|nr:MAG: hypothetical protein DMF69_08240 [Acidobacteriota bacterium]
MVEPELEQQQPGSNEENPPQSAERQSFLELTRKLAGLPLDQAAAALETSAAIASISLRAGIEFLRAVPAASQVLLATELKSWGELGRRLAMGDYESAVAFFATGIEDYREVPRAFPADDAVDCRRTRIPSSHSAHRQSCPRRGAV